MLPVMSRASSSSRGARALRGVVAVGLTLGCASFVGGCPGGAGGSFDVTGFDGARAWKHLEAQVAFGPRPAGSDALEKTRVYLETELKACGLKPERESFTASTPVGEIAMCNVYADLVGLEHGGKLAPMIVIGSHYDTKRMSVPFLGANDGASSTAVLLELARVISAGGPRHLTYRFLFLDGEESTREKWVDPDNRYGSRHHAELLKKNGAAANIKAFVLLDMCGDKDLKFERDSYSDTWLLDGFTKAASKNDLGHHFATKPEPISDDHLSFLGISVPSVDLIDLDYGPSNKYWHTADDTTDKCSVESLAATGKIVLLGLPAVEERVLQ